MAATRDANPQHRVYAIPQLLRSAHASRAGSIEVISFAVVTARSGCTKAPRLLPWITRRDGCASRRDRRSGPRRGW
jgi:hypothetical protein